MDRENRESMDEIHLRILRVTDDLRVIQRELNCAAMQAPNDPELMEALADQPEMESVQGLKSALDQMRHFLWFYMQVVTSDSEMGEKFRQMFPFVLALDQLWAVAPFLLIQEIGLGAAFAVCAALLYLPFSERTLIRMAYVGPRAQ